jgi:hypothetical protein
MSSAAKPPGWHLHCWAASSLGRLLAALGVRWRTQTRGATCRRSPESVGPGPAGTGPPRRIGWRRDRPLPHRPLDLAPLWLLINLRRSPLRSGVRRYVGRPRCRSPPQARSSSNPSCGMRNSSATSAIPSQLRRLVDSSSGGSPRVRATNASRADEAVISAYHEAVISAYHWSKYAASRFGVAAGLRDVMPASSSSRVAQGACSPRLPRRL